MPSNFFDIERLIHSIKTAIAALIGLMILHIGGFSGGQWIVISILVVMCAQIYVGSVVQKGYFRFLGTFIGCLLATFSIIFLGNSLLSVAIVIAISSFIFSYIATTRENLMYAATLGAVTTSIIILAPNPSVAQAGERFLEISIGIFIATFVSQFILPIHARTHLRRTQATTLEQLRLRYIACLITPPDNEELSYEELDENIVKLLTKQRQLAKEAMREPLGESYDPKLFLQSLHAEKEILRSIDFMNSARSHLNNHKDLFTRSDALKAFNADAVKALNIIINAVQADKQEEHIHLPMLDKLTEDLTSRLPLPRPQEWIYIDGFLFAAEILVTNLMKLAHLYKIPLYNSSPPLQSE